MIGRARAVSGAMAPRDALIAGVGRVLRHHRRVSAVLYVVGVLGVLSYPLLARRVFIDENAFLHGHGAIGFGADEALRAHEYALKAEGLIDALGADADGNQIYDALTAFAAAELDALGLDVSAREYPIDADRRGRRRAGENAGDADVASRKTTHAVVRAVKSSGREGVVFATPIGASDTDGPRADRRCPRRRWAWRRPRPRVPTISPREPRRASSCGTRRPRRRRFLPRVFFRVDPRRSDTLAR